MDAQLSMDLDSIIAANQAAKKRAQPAKKQQQDKQQSGSGRGSRGGAGGASSSSGGGGGRDRDRGASRASGAPRQQQQQQALTTGSFKITISNLDGGVTEADLKTLFDRVGRVKRVQLFYNKTGKSQGTAQISFHSKEDSLAAVSRYNNVSLDGKPMHIEMLMDPSNLALAATAPKKPAGGNQAAAGNGRNRTTSNRGGRDGSARDGGRTRGARGTGRSGGAGGASKPERAAPKTQEDLDRELSEYMSAGAPAGAGDAMMTD
ncbi:hypothetical protein BC828DRAFT_378351 [Blastocladiella britannica]|nr:hypothetical protein BC828DRAFT_378351 [Blastocladiella britannica]